MPIALAVPTLPPPRNRARGRTESVYGPAELWDRLGRIASDAGRSKSDLIVGILLEWLARFEEDERRGR